MRVGQPNPRNWRNVPRKPRYIWLLATRQLARKRQRSLMSLLITSPATVAAAATHLAGIGSALSTANAAAAAPTTALSVAGADEVSVLIAALFEAYAQEYQALSAQALAFHDQFVQALNMGAVCYAAAETANATPLQALQTVQQNVLTVVNAPTQAGHSDDHRFGCVRRADRLAHSRFARTVRWAPQPELNTSKPIAACLRVSSGNPTRSHLNLPRSRGGAATYRQQALRRTTKWSGRANSES